MSLLRLRRSAERDSGPLQTSRGAPSNAKPEEKERLLLSVPGVRVAYLSPTRIHISTFSF